jgi:inhibitor of cysteine peptidase
MPETLLSMDDNGKAIDVAVGASLRVRLDESPTTGYAWANKTVGDVLILDDSGYSLTTAQPVGGGGVRTLRFRVNKSGTTTLSLKLLRQWEGEASVVDTFSVAVRASLR